MLASRGTSSDYLPPSLRDDPIQFYSCFISYSSKDDEFAQRLHRDLQASKVRVWFAPDDLKIGDKFGEAIQEAIRVRDKVILILSAQSLTSAWVAKEVRTTLDEEQRRGRLVLFPIRIDDALEDCTDQWAYNLKRERQIGDFSAWKDYNTYKKALDRLLRDLKGLRARTRRLNVPHNKGNNVVGRCEERPSLPTPTGPSIKSVCSLGRLAYQAAATSLT